MAHSCSESAVFSMPAEKCWQMIRDFDFPAKYIGTVEKVDILEKAGLTCVGAVRAVTWKTKEVEKHRLLAIDDLERKICWELVEAEPPAEITGRISTVKVDRITENNSCLVTWSCEFAADVKPDLLKFTQKSLKEDLVEMKGKMK
ncbi:unnamed protein product [Vitrella brassicaformis CCMP3155]|uniref:Bet v I/Major latex protein domain-containing protein n=2 Tax=Vitrella brassicaformis TaxID=1169539 RepID=A0A0G4GN98_VITBC|nr:unnamed protein product [Vitrella brassicaformis CCMP3155]|mmetsp:Transcript_22347/g.55075  ORF Transcript_22347/g.55075 Transcript_22347/m.55075 type:complete len:145 (+) Transcript_22347:103-537(+)|eukprot:CEM31673.1 unnamed protein product [Vitrella brassicaformis CCMP3155]